MKIEWNRVTWYSKLLALILLGLTIWLGLYFKSEFERVSQIQPIIVESVTNTSNWKTYKNEAIGFEITIPSSWYIQDTLDKKSCCLDIFSSADPYDNDRLREDVTKAQFQYWANTARKSKEEFISGGLERKELETLIWDEDSIKTIENENGLDVLHFASAISKHTYFIAQSSDFSKGIWIISWGSGDEQVRKIVSTFKFTK